MPTFSAAVRRGTVQYVGELFACERLSDFVWSTQAYRLNKVSAEIARKAANEVSAQTGGIMTITGVMFSK